MEDRYKQLGFKQPEFLVNHYGIRIYMGTKGKDDWGLVIPKELVKLKSRHYFSDNDYAVYMESEEYVLQTAAFYTQLAEKHKRIGGTEHDK